MTAASCVTRTSTGELIKICFKLFLGLVHYKLSVVLCLSDFILLIMKLLLWNPVCRPSSRPRKLLSFTSGLFDADVSSSDCIASN